MQVYEHDLLVRSASLGLFYYCDLASSLTNDFLFIFLNKCVVYECLKPHRDGLVDFPPPVAFLINISVVEKLNKL